MTDTGMIEVIEAREVPLGGLRAMTVRRTLPSRRRTMIGAWCFADHFGPDPVAETGGMIVTPHPHTGLQTVSWLFEGAIDHADSLGTEMTVRPGEVNLMTAGRGISHSEISTADTEVLHGVQLWVASPEATREGDPAFEHHEPEAVAGHRWRARVFVGSLLGSTSPVRTDTALVGAEIVLEPRATLTLPLRPDFEYGALLDSGDLAVDGVALGRADLGCAPPGAERLTLTSDGGARLILLGGAPLGEEIVMWWNFIGRSDEEVRASREQWQAQITDDGEHTVDGRFGVVPGDQVPIPAPALPKVRLRTRA